MKPWERYNQAKRDGKVSAKRHVKLERRFAMLNALLEDGTPESRKRYKEASTHSYGRDKHNLYGFWNGSTKRERKRPMKASKQRRGITTLTKLRGETYKPYTKQ